jgi:hypothetical protein
VIAVASGAAAVALARLVSEEDAVGIKRGGRRLYDAARSVANAPDVG